MSASKRHKPLSRIARRWDWRCREGKLNAARLSLFLLIQNYRDNSARMIAELQRIETVMSNALPKIRSKRK